MPNTGFLTVCILLLASNYVEKDAKPGAPGEMIDLHVTPPGESMPERSKTDIKGLLKNVTANFERYV
jgi:hypothetical protein